METLNVSILDDNMFFLKLFHERISRHSMQLELGSGNRINIQSYTSYLHFLDQFDNSTDLVFLDFDLGSGFNALGVIDELKKGLYMPKIAIITEHQGISKLPSDSLKYIDSYIKKDNYVVPKSCLLIQELLEKKFSA